MELDSSPSKSICDHPDCVCLPLSYKMPSNYLERGHSVDSIQVDSPVALRCARCHGLTCDARLHTCTMCSGIFCSGKTSSVSLAALNPVCLRCKYPDVFNDVEEFMNNLQ